ncbi:MAG: hypothetical protein WCG34_05060 [Leptolinea sp.]
MNEILCSNCGKINPPETEFCEKCLAPLKIESASETSSENTQPDWLKRVRERSQEEKPNTPPLGDFGEAENRPFDQPLSPGEIPDWLKDLQNSEPPQKEVSPEPEIDWIARLHEIQADSNQSLSQSTTFYSDEELAAMAASARKLESTPDSVPEPSSEKSEVPTSLAEPFPLKSEEEPQVSEPDPSNISYPQPEANQPADIPQSGQQVLENQVNPEEESASRLNLVPPSGFSPETPASVSSDETDLEFSADAQTEEKSLFPNISEAESAQPIEDKRESPLSSFFESEKKEETAGDVVAKEEPLIPEGALQPQYSRAAEYSGRLEISESQRDSITLLKSMLVGEIQPQVSTPLPGKFSGRFLRAVLGILLLVTMGYPFFTGYLLMPPQAIFSPGVVKMHNTITALPENAPFLIVTDFEPAFSGEMKAASIGVIDNLMMKGMNFTVISTVPSGPALARDLFATVRPASFAYPPEKIAVLGFIPGGTTGLQDFIRSPRQAAPLLDGRAYAWTYPAALPVKLIQDYAGVMVITENAETGRAWIEQLHGSLIDKPLLMVVSVQSAPIIRPYLDSGQLSGLISGRVEGAMYDKMMNVPPRTAIEMSSYQMGMILAVGLIILGGLYGILKKIFIRQPVESTEEWHGG